VVDDGEVASIVTRICQECTDDDNNRIAMNVCGGLQLLVELTLSDVGGAARSALNAVMKELAKNADLKERIMQLLLDARASAAEAEATTSSYPGGGGGGGVGVDATAVAAAAAMSTAGAPGATERSGRGGSTSGSGSGERSGGGGRGGGSSAIARGPLQGLEIEHAAAAASTAPTPAAAAAAAATATAGRGGGGGERPGGREEKALQERLRAVEEDLSGAHRYVSHSIAQQLLGSF
jgi:hypothetical protein